MAVSTLTKEIKQIDLTGTTSSAGLIKIHIPYSQVIGVKVKVGYNAFCAVREASDGKATVLFFGSSGGALTSLNEEYMEFTVMYQ